MQETNNSNGLNVNKPKWKEAHQLGIFKRDRGVEHGTLEKQLQHVASAGLENRAPTFQVQPSNCAAPLSL